MPRTTCKTKCPLLCLALSALVLHSAVAVAAEPGSNKAPDIAAIVRASLSLEDASDTSESSRDGMTGSAVLVVPVDEINANDAGTEHASSLIERALSLVGVTYRRGGNSPQSGLDCSGLVRLVFHDVSGLELPRRAEEISRIGLRVSRQDLRPGDLIFFNTMRRTISHVGIYLGDGQFIHAPASGGHVRIESMNMPYWIKRFSVARRVGE